MSETIISFWECTSYTFFASYIEKTSWINTVNAVWSIEKWSLLRARYICIISSYNCWSIWCNQTIETWRISCIWCCNCLVWSNTSSFLQIKLCFRWTFNTLFYLNIKYWSWNAAIYAISSIKEWSLYRAISQVLII